MFSLGGGFNGSSLEALAASVGQAFAAIQAQAQTRWFKQHGSDGAHKDVTATSLVLAGLLQANGRINIGTPVHVNRPLEADTQPFYLGAGSRGAAAALASFVRVTTSSSDPSPLVWHGLDAAGRADGDVVVFLNDGNEVIEFVSESASAPAHTQFFANSFLPSGNYELGSGGLGLVVYSTNQFLGAKFWHWMQMG
jgi:hypothetical protein